MGWCFVGWVVEVGVVGGIVGIGVVGDGWPGTVEGREWRIVVFGGLK